MRRRRQPLLAACAALAAAALLTPPPARAVCCYDRVFILGADPPVGHGVFRFPQGVTFTPGGQFVFVADQYSSVVQKFERAGNWQMQVGWPASDGQLGRFGVIGGVATDLDGHLYVLDSENDRVQVFRSDNGDFVAAFGSHGSTVGRFFLGNNTGAGGLAVFQAASGDPPLVYVADQDNHRVQRFALTQPARPGDSDPTRQRLLPSGTR